MFFNRNSDRSYEARINILEYSYRDVVNRYNNLAKRWTELVERINAKGGEDFLDYAVLKGGPTQFTADELKKLILLCHPDKHDGKPMATEMTQKLLKMKEDLE